MSEVIERAVPSLDAPSTPLVPDLAGLPVTRVADKALWVKMMVWGDPGVGKTRLAASASEVEEMSPCLYINIEGGDMTFRKLYPDIDIITPRDVLDATGQIRKTAWRRLQDVYEAIRKGVGYRTIIIDNLSETQKLSMGAVMRDTVNKDPERDPDVPAQRDWGKSGEQIRRFVRAFRDLDCHVIYTAWSARKQDQQTGAITYEPSMPGKLSGEVPGYLDVVLYMYAREEKSETGEMRIVRRILSQPTAKISIAKDRSDSLPIIMEDPTMTKIAALVMS
jgi:hypothetical protein